MIVIHARTSLSEILPARTSRRHSSQWTTTVRLAGNDARSRRCYPSLLESFMRWYGVDHYPANDGVSLILQMAGCPSPLELPLLREGPLVWRSRHFDVDKFSGGCLESSFSAPLLPVLPIRSSHRRQFEQDGQTTDRFRWIVSRFSVDISGTTASLPEHLHGSWILFHSLHDAVPG
jgi:hypothetical protein